MKELLGKLYSMYGYDASEQFHRDDLRRYGFRIIFSKCTSEICWWENTLENLIFLRAAQNYFNDLLACRGYVFLNEILDWLGINQTKIGHNYGWSKRSGDTDIYFLDFVDRMYTMDSDHALNEIVLNFNCNHKPIIDYVF